MNTDPATFFALISHSALRVCAFQSKRAAGYDLVDAVKRTNQPLARSYKQDIQR